MLGSVYFTIELGQRCRQDFCKKKNEAGDLGQVSKKGSPGHKRFCLRSENQPRQGHFFLSSIAVETKKKKRLRSVSARQLQFFFQI